MKWEMTSGTGAHTFALTSWTLTLITTTTVIPVLYVITLPQDCTLITVLATSPLPAPLDTTSTDGTLTVSAPPVTFILVTLWTEADTRHSSNVTHNLGWQWQQLVQQLHATLCPDTRLTVE